MKRIFFAIGLAGILVSTGCGDRQLHFIKSRVALEQVTKDFEQKKEAFPHGGFPDVCGDPALALPEREALMFLYAYMPIGDVTDYSSDFYLRNVRASFRALEEMPWCANIPDDIFRHFVLPVRVNNENMDESRMVFYEELKERVKNLSLREAALEVNHWCHEKVVYTPSDSRTSSPLASVKTAYGRCGEESVFAVAALRSVGIPARQVYTPRWAHTDDNHAWVEAWVDGKWYFMGACEPEPVLNMAWFNSPAYRSMLMHTKVFGRYNSPEEVMEQTNCYTEINVTSNYAPVAKVTVTATDKDGKPMPGAIVEFKLYNYAEFYTVSTKAADAKGQASLLAGKGDMLVWASLDGKFGFAKVSFGKDEHVTIPLDKRPEDSFDISFDIVPPVEGSIPAEATEGQKAANALRLLQEDSIRNQYTASFTLFIKEEAAAIAGGTGLDADEIASLLAASRGNRQELSQFIRQAKDKQSALGLLAVISPKDLRDTPAAVLADHLPGNGENKMTAWFFHLHNPRVSNELLTPYRSFFREAIPPQLASAVVADPQVWVKWVADSIVIANHLNPQRIPVSPAGVWKSRLADAHSRDIFFVAALRSLGIPSQVEPVAGKVQYVAGGNWVDVDFAASDAVIPEEGAVVATYFPPSPAVRDPGYYSHFTIARVQAGGRLQTLNFESRVQADMGNGDTWSALLKNPLPVEAGDYLLVTGARMAKGNVLAQITSFHVLPGGTAEVNLQMREDKEDVQVIGSIDAEATFRQATGGESSILSVTGRGYFILGILGANQEPTNHALRDIASAAGEFNDWGRSMILLFKNRQDWERFKPEEFGELPSTVTYGIDDKQTVARMLASASILWGELPVFVIADTFGRVVFISRGYTIGLGNQMMQTIHKL